MVRLMSMWIHTRLLDLNKKKVTSTSDGHERNLGQNILFWSLHRKVSDSKIFWIKSNIKFLHIELLAKFQNFLGCHIPLILQEKYILSCLSNLNVKVTWRCTKICLEKFHADVQWSVKLQSSAHSQASLFLPILPLPKILFANPYITVSQHAEILHSLHYSFPQSRKWPSDRY